MHLIPKLGTNWTLLDLSPYQNYTILVYTVKIMQYIKDRCMWLHQAQGFFSIKLFPFYHSYIFGIFYYMCTWNNNYLLLNCISNMIFCMYAKDLYQMVKGE